VLDDYIRTFAVHRMPQKSGSIIEFSLASRSAIRSSALNPAIRALCSLQLEQGKQYTQGDFDVISLPVTAAILAVYYVAAAQRRKPLYA